MSSMFALAAALAFWQGILTSISPCPLSTNIAAISYVGRRLDARHVLFAGLLYTVGRSITYILIAALIVMGTLSVPGLSHFLQKYMNQLLGPLLILVGMFLLDWLPLPVPNTGVSSAMQARIDRAGIWGAGLLGIVFALTFCPISAALFFGGLLPLATQHESPILLPFLYGVGTAIPVLVFAALLAFGARSVGRVFSHVQHAERWLRWGTGALCIVLGIIHVLRYIFHIGA